MNTTAFLQPRVRQLSCESARFDNGATSEPSRALLGMAHLRSPARVPPASAVLARSPTDRPARLAALALACGLATPACDPLGAGHDQPAPERAPLGKSERAGSCASGDTTYCGGQSAGACWCDDECAGFGDCCADVDLVCGCANGACAPGSEGTSAGDDGPKSDTGGGGSESSTGDDACTSVPVMSDVDRQPADILIVVDNSGSMDFEAAAVQANMNAFSTQMVAAEIDPHVVLISSYPGNGKGICIDPPLGSGSCPADDNNPPLYTHIDRLVESNDALAELIATHPMWAGAMRATAAKHVIVISDADSTLSAADFTTMWAGLDPTYVPVRVHAIAAAQDPVQSCLENHACCVISAEEGTVYRQLTEETMGVFGDLCSQEFQPIFDAIAEQVTVGAGLACEFSIPTPPDGQALDPTQVNVEFRDDTDTTVEFSHVESPAECAGADDRWYYDDPAAPTAIVLCPQTCAAIQGFTMAEISIQFGCPTMLAK